MHSALVLSCAGIMGWWRRRLAGGLTSRWTSKNRQRDAGATKPSTPQQSVGPPIHLLELSEEMQIKAHLAQQGSNEDEGRRSALWRIQELRQRRHRKENEIAVEPERIQPDLQAHRPARRASEDSGTDWRRPWRWKMRQSCGRKGSSRRLPSSSRGFT